MISLTRKAGTVDVHAIIRIIDSTDGTPELGVVFNTSGIDIQYRRELAASVAITEVTLAALTTAHTDGGFLHIGNGYYRVDLPDAAVAAGATGVLVHGVVTGMVVIGCYIELVAYDPADTVRLGLTGIPNVAAGSSGGLPVIGTGANTFKSDGSANVTFANTSIATVTTLTNLPAITSNWLTAAGIAASALNGKGDWNIGKTGYALSTAGVQAIWDAATSALTTAGSIGKLLVDKMVFLTGDAFTRIGAAGAGLTALGDTRIANLDAAVSTRLSTAGYTAPPSVSAIADQVWDEVLSGHLGAGSTGAALNGAGSAGDPWVTALPGAYGAGTAGKLVGDNINATISSRATPAQVATELTTYGALKPTVGGRTLDVAVSGEAGLDWGNIGGQSTSQNLSATTINVVNTLTNDPAGVTTLLARIPAALFSGITSMAQWLGLIAGKQVGNATARTELRATGAGSGAFDETTDSQEAIRDRGDAAWTSAAGDSAGVTTLLTRIASAITITGGKVDVNDKTGFALTSGERDSIASAMLVLTDGVETGITLKQALRAILAFVSGTSAGAATSTIIFHAPDGTTARITMTVDPLTGERSVMVLNL